MIYLNPKTAVLSGLVLSAVILAATEKTATKAPKSAPTGGSEKPPVQTGGNMTMMEMMGLSRMSCMAASDSLDTLLKTVQEARKSDDKARMKAALETTESHIAGMKGHMGQCLNMMGRMGTMMGGDSSYPGPRMRRDRAGQY